MPISFEEHVIGISTLIWVIICTAVALVIMLRYRKYKQNILIYWGIGWLGMSFIHHPAVVSYIVAFFNDTGLTLQQYLLFGMPLTAITFMFYSYVVMELVWKEKQKIFIIVVGIIHAAFLGAWYLIVFIAPDTLGELESIVDIKYAGLGTLYALYLALFFVILGIILSTKLIKSDSKENKWKGIFLLVCFISYTTAAFLDSLPLSVTVLLMLRFVFIFAAILMYIGWLMPDFIKKRLIKE